MLPLWAGTVKVDSAGIRDTDKSQLAIAPSPVSEYDVDTIFVMFSFAIDHCILRLEATLGLVSSLTVPPLAVGGRDADI